MLSSFEELVNFLMVMIKSQKRGIQIPKKPLLKGSFFILISLGLSGIQSNSQLKIGGKLCAKQQGCKYDNL